MISSCWMSNVDQTRFWCRHPAAALLEVRSARASLFFTAPACRAAFPGNNDSADTVWRPRGHVRLRVKVQ